MFSAIALLSLYRIGYADLVLQRLIGVGKGVLTQHPLSRLANRKVDNQVYLSSEGREINS
jgi:hypothetical protein